MTNWGQISVTPTLRKGLRLITCEMIDIFPTSRRKLHATSWIDRKEMHISGPLMHAAML